MTAPRSPRPTSLPKGISAGGLGARIGAYLLDAVVLVVVEVAIGLVVGLHAPHAVQLAVTVLGGLIALAWAIVVWWRLAVKGATPGMTVTRLELIGHRDGKPIGWGRALPRALIFFGLGITGVGLVIMLILLVLHPLRQGWHDLAVGAVMIGARAPSSRSGGAGPGANDRSRPAGHTVGLPAHLTGGQPSSYASAPPAYGPGPQQPVPGQLVPFGDPFAQPPQSAPSAPSRPAPAWTPPPPPDTQPLPTNAPGQPGQPVPPQPAPTPPGPSPMDSGNEATHLVAKRGGRPQRGADQGWTINLDDGRQVAVTGLVLLGRDPAPRPGEQGADLVTVTDNSRTVSKTHLAVGVDNKGIYVMDRGSTNGSAIATPSGTYEPCAPGDLVRVREGQIISFGDHRLEIRRTYLT